MQTAKSTLKLKVPVSVVTPILKKQVVVFDVNSGRKLIQIFNMQRLKIDM